MMKVSVQLEMGMFSVAICGLIGVAFGMNLESSLEEVRNEALVRYNKLFVPSV